VPRTQTADMPFLDHLEELRWRIIKSLAAVLVTVAASFAVLAQFDVIGILARPILPLLNGHKLIFTHPTDSFQIYMNMSIILGLIFASPVVVYQAWAFLAPALHKHERRMVVPVTIGAVLLFVCGVAVSWFGVMPLALKWLLAFQTASMEPMISGLEYFDFLFMMSLAFGLAFELPIVILALTALGLVTPQFLRKYRRHAIVACVFVGAFLTPGDLVWTTLAMAVPLYLLYELSIVLSDIVYRRRARERDGADDDDSTDNGFHQKRLLPSA
jgi:sec-independent protein translocase protein TatC